MTTQAHDTPAPGYFIREELEARGWSQRDLSYVLGVPEQAVNLLVSGKRGISADMAKALGDAFDVPAEFFLNLQKAYDLSRARPADPSVARKARLQSAYPVREMIKRGWLDDGPTDLLEAQMARFFEVKTANNIPHIAHAAKKTRYDDTPPAQVAWLYRARQVARETVTQPYSEKALRCALAPLRALIVAPEEARHVPRLLSDCGVRFVLIETLPTAKIDGACFWLDDRKPVVALSMRHDRIDNFWFVLRHELEHVLRRDGRDAGRIDFELEGANAGVDASLPPEEREANSKAAEFCVASKELDSFIARKRPFFSERDLLAFALRLQVHPGIVAGQLRRRLDRWDLFTKHLSKIRHIVAPSAMVDGWGEVAPIRS